jgi:hypothetical protein
MRYGGMELGKELCAAMAVMQAVLWAVVLLKGAADEVSALCGAP